MPNYALRAARRQAAAYRRADVRRKRRPVAGPPTPPPAQLRRIRAQRPAVAGPPTPSAPRLAQIRQHSRAVERRQAVAERERRVRLAHAQARTYRSLARAIHTEARRQQTAALSRRALGALGQVPAVGTITTPRRVNATEAAKQIMGAPGRGPAQRYQAERRSLASIISKYGLAAGKQTHAEREAKRMAPALKVLEQLQRPEYAVGGAIHGIKQGDVGAALSGAAKGALLQEKRTPGGEILGGWKPKSGIGKALRGTAGFALDVGLDPTTYVTLGGASVAEKTAINAAERIASKAARARLQALAPDIAAGKLTVREAKRLARTHGREVGDRAARRIVSRAPAGKRGVTVRVAGGRTARGIGRRVAPRPVARAVGRRQAAAPLTRATAAVRRERAGTSLAARAGRNVGASLHAGVRPAGVSSVEQRAVKAIKREGRATEEASVREANARANALLSRLSPEDERKVIDAIEARNLNRLPEHLHDVAHDVRSYLRYVRRQERRSGTLTGEVGSESRSRAEVALSARTQAPRTRDWAHWRQRKAEAKRQRERLTHSYLERPEIRENPALRAEVAKKITNAAHREREADEALNSLARKQTQAEGARVSQRIAKRERLTEQARGYFPRFPKEEVQAERGLFQRLAEPLRPSPQRVGKSKVRPETSRRREYRESRAQLREGSGQQQAVEASFTPKLRETVSLRGIKGARGVRNATVNRKIAERFGERLPSDPGRDVVAKLAERGRSVYHVDRGDLVKLGAGDTNEIIRAAKSPSQRAGADIRARQYAKAEGLKPPDLPERAGRYVVLRDDLVARAQDLGEGGRIEFGAVGEAWDAANRSFKSLALMTPAYLMRNLGGDMFNAWTDENVFRLLRNQARGQRALGALGKRERALARKSSAKSRKALRDLGEIKQAGNRFSKLLSPKQREIQLTPEQAREIAGPSADRLYNAIRKGNPDLSKDQIRAEIEHRLTTGKVSPLHVAQLAEKMGVIRQGRFLELMEQGKSGFGKQRPKSWEAAVKRVEDSTRLATFMGGLQRGMSPREAASRATDLHFDYGDLTSVEKNVFRRLMPFYTFPSRNIPLQAKQVVTRPGKYATVAKAQDAAAQAAGLQPGWQQNTSEFEARQLGLPLRFGGKVVTVSLGAPFTDLNDVTSFAEGATAIPRSLAGQRTGGDVVNLAEAPLKRIVEAVGPWKIFGELRANQSGFFREDIEPKGSRLTRAPEWAAAIYKTAPAGLKDLITSTTDLQIKNGVPMWRKKAPYALRSVAPGIIGAAGTVAGAIPGVPDLGVKTGKDYRGRTEAQRLIGILGPRVVTMDRAKAAQNRAYAHREALDTQLEDYRQRFKESHGGKIWSDPSEAPRDYRRMLAARRKIEHQIQPPSSDEGPALTGAAAMRAERSRQIHRSNTSGAAAMRAARAAAR